MKSIQPLLKKMIIGNEGGQINYKMVERGNRERGIGNRSKIVISVLYLFMPTYLVNLYSIAKG